MKNFTLQQSPRQVIDIKISLSDKMKLNDRQRDLRLLEAFLWGMTNVLPQTNFSTTGPATLETTIDAADLHRVEEQIKRLEEE